jgi:hypothetical protein
VSILPFPESATENGGQAGYGDEFDIPKGTYSACLIDASTKLFFFGRSPKVVLTFRILDLGPYFEKLVRGFYAVKRIKGKPRSNGTFEAGPRSRLLRDISKLIDSRPPTDHVPERIIEAAIFEIEVRLVDTVSGEKLTESMQYAVVDRIVRRLQG